MDIITCMVSYIFIPPTEEDMNIRSVSSSCCFLVHPSASLSTPPKTKDKEITATKRDNDYTWQKMSRRQHESLFLVLHGRLANLRFGAFLGGERGGFFIDFFLFRG